MEKKKLLALFIILSIFFIILIIIRKDEDTWLCQDNQWVKHGNPSKPRPTEGCGKESIETQIANPASVYCQEQGGKIEIRTANDGSQTGWCLVNNQQCEEWQFYRTQKCSSN